MPSPALGVYVRTLSDTELRRLVGQRASAFMAQFGDRVIRSAKRTVGKLVTVVSAGSEGSKHVRRGRGPFKGKLIRGSSQGQPPRKETGELQESIGYSLATDGTLGFFMAEHGAALEFGGGAQARPFLMKIIRRESRSSAFFLSRILDRGK